MTVKFLEMTRKWAVSVLDDIKRLQDEEYRMTPEFARSQAEIVRAIDISQEIEGRMSNLGGLLPANFCTSMPMKSLHLELREASRIRYPSSGRVNELRERIDAVMSAHIAELRVRHAIRDIDAEVQDLELLPPPGDRRAAFIAHRNWRTCTTGWRLRDRLWTYILKLETDGAWSGIIIQPGQAGVFAGRLSNGLVGARGDLFDAAQRLRAV